MLGVRWHRGGAVGGATVRGERVAWLRTLQHDPRTPRKGRALRSRILSPSRRRTTWSLEVAAAAAAAVGTHWDAAGGGPLLSPRLYDPEWSHSISGS